jgi:hypothetical protein
VELYVGTVDRLRDDIGSLDRDWYESLATTDMQKISLQSIEMHQDNYRTGKWKRGIIPRPKQIDSQTRLVLQFKVVQQDGTEQIGPPFDVPTGDRVARQRLTNELYEQLRGKRNPIAPKLNFVIEGSSKPEQSNMKVGNSSTSIRELRSSGWGKLSFTADQHFVKAAVWSPDGLYVYLVSKLGRVHMIRADDQTEVRTLNLFAYCVDMNYSSEGLVVLGGEKLWILDPTSLELRRKIEVPLAHRISCTFNSSHAIVAAQQKLSLVNLKAGTVSSPSVVGKNRQPISFKELVGVAIEGDGKHVVVADSSRLYRCRIEEASLTVVDSSPEIEPTKFLHSTGEERVAVWIKQNMPGFPYAMCQIFKFGDLKNPVIGLSVQPRAGFAMNPISGGILLDNE